MTDNTNIEAPDVIAMKRAFEEEYIGYEFPSDMARAGALNNFAFGWFAARRTALNNADPIGYLVEWAGPDDIGCADLVFDIPDADVAEGYDSIKSVFLRQSAPAPLTEARITEIAREFGSFDVTGRLLKLVRGIEQAHGIKESL